LQAVVVVVQTTVDLAAEALTAELVEVVVDLLKLGILQ
jgi:hypothetical protein